MSAPLPSPRLSPTAGFVDALRRLYIRRAPAYIASREAELTGKCELNARLKEAQ